MQEEEKSSETESMEDVESGMQKASLIISLVGLGLMVAGFANVLASGISRAMPGGSVLSLTRLMHPAHLQISLAAMSVGIILLALVPTARVVLALGIYVRRRNLLDALIALIVLAELIFSMRMLT